MNNITTPQQLLDYMKNNFEYGWIGIDGSRHIENLKDFKTLYRTGSLEKTLESKVATCVETAVVVKAFLDSKNIYNRLFCHRAFKTDENAVKKIKMHIVILYEENGNWIRFEYSSRRKQGLHKFSSLEEALNQIKEEFQTEGESRELKEIYELPSGLTFKEFNDYVDGLDFAKQR